MLFIFLIALPVRCDAHAEVIVQMILHQVLFTKSCKLSTMFHNWKVGAAPEVFTRFFCG